MIRCGQLIQPLINLLRDQLLAYDLVQMDETTGQVLKEPGTQAGKALNFLHNELTKLICSLEDGRLLPSDWPQYGRYSP
tara:strand:- start:1539 stop:1775 length:237 start_codon:yes stop_codon:yes gene_type:complete